MTNVWQWFLWLVVGGATLLLVGACDARVDVDDTVPAGTPAGSSRPKPSDVVSVITQNTWVKASEVVGVTTKLVDAWENNPCGPFIFRSYIDEAHIHENFLHWSGDGLRLLFNRSEIIWSLSLDDQKVTPLANANPGMETYSPGRGSHRRDFLYGFHADVSPDGQQVVYASCAYEAEHDPAREYLSASHELYMDQERANINYEIAVVDIDGENSRRLTENLIFENFPVWSPDGTRIAFLARLDHPSTSVAMYEQRLYTMKPDGSDVREVAVDYEEVGGVALSPPVWSPDGEWLAFYALPRKDPFYLSPEEDPSPAEVSYTLYTARVDGSELHEIGSTERASSQDARVPPPSWSPDGERLAFISGKDLIYTARADGTDTRRIATNYRSRHLAWSPVGDEIVFLLRGRPHSVSLANGDATVRRWPLPEALRVRLVDLSDSAKMIRRHANLPTQLVWAPDGSQIAIRYPGQLLVVIDRESAKHRVVLEGDVRVAWEAQEQAAATP